LTEEGEALLVAHQTQDPVFDTMEGKDVARMAADTLASVSLEVEEEEEAEEVTEDMEPFIPMEELEALAAGEVVPLEQADQDALAQVDLDVVEESKEKLGTILCDTRAPRVCDGRGVYEGSEVALVSCGHRRLVDRQSEIEWYQAE